MKKRRFLSGFLALALCAAMLCVPTIATEKTDTERLPSAPVRTWGTLTRETAGKTDRYMLENTSGENTQRTVLLVDDKTLCLDAVSGDPVKLSDVKDGTTAYAYVGPIMLTSEPPQTGVTMLLVNVPADFAAPSYYTVTAVSTATSSGIQVTTDQGINVTIPATATFFPYLTKNIVTIGNIQVGSRILVWSGLDQKVSKVMVFAHDAMSLISDVLESSAHYDGVKYVLSAGLMDGATTTTFAPNDGMTRATMATALWRAAGKPAAKDAKGFSDVSSDASYATAVYWAKENNLVQGFSDGTFAPDRTITREQMSVILYRYEQMGGGGFKGAWMFQLDFTDRDQIAQSAYEGVAWCVMKEILTGRSDKSLAPKQTVTRAQAATMLMRYLTLETEAVTLPATK